MIYLDWAASAPIDSATSQAFLKSLNEDFANPSAAHKFGKNLSKKIEKARISFLGFLNADKNDQFIFTSSATESNNTLIKGIELEEGAIVYYSPIDHPSMVKPIEYIAQKDKLDLRKFSLLDNSWAGEIDINTRLVLLTHVHSQTGLKLNLQKLIQSIKAQAPNAHVHVDAVQSFAKIEIKCKEWNINSLSLSGHKIGASKGIAGLYLKEKIQLVPLLHGGGQENSLRSSTQAAPLIFSLYDVAVTKLDSMVEIFEHVRLLKNRVRESLRDTGEFPFCSDEYSPYIQCFIVNGIPSDVLMRHLEMDQIYIASSSACSSKIKGHNPIFEGLGISKDKHKNVLRISFGDLTSQADIDEFCLKLQKAVKEIKGILR